MDKQSNTKIKIKINGDDHPFKEEVAIHNWKSSEVESAAASENVADDDQFDWVLPDVEENTVNEFKKINYEPAIEKPKSGKFSKKNASSHLLTIIISAGTAISIGILFGFIMLKIISYQSAGVSQKTLGNQLNLETAGASNQQTKSVSLPSLSTSIIQGGVYDNATSPANEIKAKGLPTSIISLEGKQYIFIGVSDNLETAKLLAEELKKLNVNVYAKQLTLEGKKINITTKDEQTFAEQTISLYKKMASAASNGYITGSLNSERLSEIEMEYKQIRGLKELNNKEIRNLFSLQSECYQHLLNFQKNKDTNEMLSAEQGLLSYLKQLNEM